MYRNPRIARQIDWIEMRGSGIILVLRALVKHPGRIPICFVSDSGANLPQKVR